MAVTVFVTDLTIRTMDQAGSKTVLLKDPFATVDDRVDELVAAL